MKKILIIGKIPPIQGGVSESTFYSALDLSHNGYEVHLVTNADEVEDEFRMHLNEHDYALLDQSQHLHIHRTSVGGASFIPRTLPYLSKLLGLGISVMNTVDIDLIYGHYFEPYGIAAAVLSEIYKKPLVIKHAGSDLCRLSRHSDLFHLYKFVLEKADIILSSGGVQVIEQFNQFNIDTGKIIKLHGSRLPEVFLKNITTASIPELNSFTKDWLEKRMLKPALNQLFQGLNLKNFDPNLPTIGIYGKVADVKGCYDLVKALGVLANKGITFNFLAIIGGEQKELESYLNTLSDYPVLLKQTWLYPFIAPWKIPEFLKLCSITCFLERKFPIAIHGSRIPREILSSGSCLVCSKEIYDKLSFKQNLIDRKNFILIENPSDITELSHKLEILITDKILTRVIGIHGKCLSSSIERSVSSTNNIIQPFKSLLEYSKTAIS